MPPELLPATPLQWGIVGVLISVIVAFVYALMSGRIVARQVVEDIRQDSEKRLDQAQEVITMWKDAAEIRKSVVDQLMPVLQEMRKDQGVILKAAVLFTQQYESGEWFGMSLWEWLKMKLTRGSAPDRGEVFDRMLVEERQAADESRQDAQQQARQARQIRQRSWYLHGEFERARTADAFSEWLFEGPTKGTEK